MFNFTTMHADMLKDFFSKPENKPTYEIRLKTDHGGYEIAMEANPSIHNTRLVFGMLNDLPRDEFRELFHNHSRQCDLYIANAVGSKYA